MALFGRSGLPHRATLSRFLAALDEPFVEALRSVFLHDALARLGPEVSAGRAVGSAGHPMGGLRCRWDQTGGTTTCSARGSRSATSAPTFIGGVCTGLHGAQTWRGRTYSYHTLGRAHTHQWLFTSGAAGNGDYRGELLQALSVIVAYHRPH